MHDDPKNTQNIDKEKEAIEHIVETKKAYHNYVAQKAKIHWLKEGDANTQFFHKSIKMRHFQQRVLAIQDSKGTWRNSPEAVQKAFEDYYIELLGSDNATRTKLNDEVLKMGNILSDQQASYLNLEY